MEPPSKKPKFDFKPKDLHIPCVMVMEMLQDTANKKGLHFKHKPRKFKRSLPDEKTKWFYNYSPTAVNGKRIGFGGPVFCKKILVKAHQLKATKAKKSCSFLEVEYIADFKVIEGKRYYLVKWVGWPREANTWESVSNLSCSRLIEEFHSDYVKQLNLFLTQRNLTWSKLFRRRKKKDCLLQHLFDIIPNNFHFEAKYSLEKQEAQAKLLAWQTSINALTRGAPLIAVENEVDLEPLPESFTYIEQNIAGVGVCIPTDPLLGCTCVGSCSLPLEQGLCCPAMHKSKPAYVNGLIKLKPGKPIFECNSRCQCGLSCPNRIVQKGPQLAMSLFRTTHKGWGVKALEPIPKGAFVMEYVGEVITNDEAESRGKIYDNSGITYLFDLDFSDVENPLTVDATNYGNISHFVNHSCSPNLQVYNVFIDNIDPSFPRIALFARRNIAINEELTFDYQMTGDMTDGQEDVTINDLTGNAVGVPGVGGPTGNDDTASDVSRSSSCSSILKRTKCLCGSTNCRGWLI